MYPHRIRLRAPWEQEPLPGEAGRRRFRRRFGYPGRIDDYERVWLTFSGVKGAVDLWLNEHFLGRHAEAGFEVDVTSLLGNRNRLEVITEGASGDAGPWEEVALEIRCSAYLRAVRAWVDRDSAKLHVAGEVVGACDRPLELYVLVDRVSLGYATIEADSAGQPFHLEIDVPAGQVPRVVRVDLVNLAQIWYAAEIEIV